VDGAEPPPNRNSGRPTLTAPLLPSLPPVVAAEEDIGKRLSASAAGITQVTIWKSSVGAGRGAGPASEKSKRILGLLCTIRRELIRVIPFNETSIPTPNAWVRFENVNREA